MTPFCRLEVCRGTRFHPSSTIALVLCTPAMWMASHALFAPGGHDPWVATSPVAALAVYKKSGLGPNPIGRPRPTALQLGFP